MKKLLVISIICLFIGLCFQPAFANDVSIGKVEQQPRGGTFVKTYGRSYDDRGHSVQQTTDGGYIITGQTYLVGASGHDVWLIKTDSNGNKLWDKNFGGDDAEYGYCVQQTTDGGYIITGQTEEFDIWGNLWLIKTDSNGNKLWDKNYGGDKEDCGKSICQTTDGGYIITGENDGRIWLIKTDNSGNMIWDKKFGGYEGKSVRQTTDGGYIILGTRAGDIYLIKTDSAGNKMWDKTFGEDDDDNGLCVEQTTDGGYIITGFSVWKYFPDSDSDAWLIKTDSNGTKIWHKVFSRTESDYGRYVQQTTDGGFILTGDTGGKVWLIKTDSKGQKIWENRFNEIRGESYSRCGRQTTDGGYIIVGYLDNFFSEIDDVLLIKTDEYGKSRNKAFTVNMLLLRILERFPLLWRVVSRLNLN